MSARVWVPRILYNDPVVELVGSHPMTPWDANRESIGGAGESSGLVAEAFEITRTYPVVVTFRFPETEWDDWEMWYTYAQLNPNDPFTMWFDKADAATARAMLLRKPMLGDGDFEPKRSTDYPGALSLGPLTLRRANNTKLGLLWYTS